MRLALLLVARDAAGDVDAPADIGDVRGEVLLLLPGAGLGVVDLLGAGVDREADDIADDRGVGRAGVGADVAPPGERSAGAGEELLEGGGVRVGVDLIGRIGVGLDEVQHVLDGLHPGRVVDARLHRVGVEQPGRIVGMLGVGRRRGPPGSRSRSRPTGTSAGRGSRRPACRSADRSCPRAQRSAH